MSLGSISNDYRLFIIHAPHGSPVGRRRYHPSTSAIAPLCANGRRLTPTAPTRALHYWQTHIFFVLLHLNKSLCVLCRNIL